MLRQVDLADLLIRGMADFHAWREAELDRLLRDREGPGDHRLRRDHRCCRGQRDHRIQQPVRRQQIERVGDGLRIAQQQRTLAEVVEQERRQHQVEPGKLDRLAAEMPHVRIERLGARQGQHGGAQGEEAKQGVRLEEADRVPRRQRAQYLRVVSDADDAEAAQRDEPEHHDRAEQRADRRRAPTLNERTG